MKKIILNKLNKGFSLMEVLIWCGIAGIFSTLVGIAGFSFMEKQKVKATIQELNIYSAAILDYYSDVGKFPTNEEGLKLLLDKGYVNNTKLLDQWQNEYIYTVSDNNNGFLLKSLGSDKKEGGDGTKKDIIIDESDKSDGSDAEGKNLEE